MLHRTDSRAFRKVMFSYSVFEMLFCSGPIFGWASLAYVLKKEDYFSEHCLHSNLQNSSSIDSQGHCPTQENSLNIAYMVGFMAVGLVSFPVGYLLDMCGPKKARYISSALYGISSAIWINLSVESQYLIYPAVLTMSSAGVFSSFAFFQVSAFLCHNNQSTIFGLQNGAYNASAVVLHIIKVLYEIQKLFKIEVLLALYCGFSAILVLIATAIFVPSKEQLMAHAARRKLLKDPLLGDNIDLNTKICVTPADGVKEELELDEHVKDDPPWVPSPINKDWLDSCSVQSYERDTGIDNMKLTTFNVILQGSKLSIDSFLDGPQKKEDTQKEGDLQLDRPSLVKLLISGIFLWHVFFASIFHLRLYFFVTTFESLLTSIPGVDEATVNTYINIFGIGQFVGVIFAPALGPYIDRIPNLPVTASYEDYRIWKIKRCAVALRITCTINVILGVSVLVQKVELQILAILAQILLRGFFYAVHFTYFAVVFPPEHYGKVTCLSLLIGVVFGSLQYPLCLLTEKKFHNNPFWVNVALLVASLLVYGQTIHLSRYAKKKENKSFSKSNKKLKSAEKSKDEVGMGCRILSFHT